MKYYDYILYGVLIMACSFGLYASLSLILGSNL